MQTANRKLQNDETDNDSAGADNSSSACRGEGSASGPAEECRPPEADASQKDADTQKRIARLESLRRIMLILAPILLLGGYSSDYLPILYASALPLAVALIVTYRIKWLEERAGK